MIRFALIVASTLGFVLTAAMGNLMVPLLRVNKSHFHNPFAETTVSQHFYDYTFFTGIQFGQTHSLSAFLFYFGGKDNTYVRKAQII